MRRDTEILVYQTQLWSCVIAGHLMISQIVRPQMQTRYTHTAVIGQIKWCTCLQSQWIVSDCMYLSEGSIEWDKNFKTVSYYYRCLCSLGHRHQGQVLIGAFRWRLVYVLVPVCRKSAGFKEGVTYIYQAICSFSATVIILHNNFRVLSVIRQILWSATTPAINIMTMSTRLLATSVLRITGSVVPFQLQAHQSFSFEF